MSTVGPPNASAASAKSRPRSRNVVFRYSAQKITRKPRQQFPEDWISPKVFAGSSPVFLIKTPVLEFTLSRTIKYRSKPFSSAEPLAAKSISVILSLDFLFNMHIPLYSVCPCRTIIHWDWIPGLTPLDCPRTSLGTSAYTLLVAAIKAIAAMEATLFMTEAYPFAQKVCNHRRLARQAAPRKASTFFNIRPDQESRVPFLPLETTSCPTS